MKLIFLAIILYFRCFLAFEILVDVINPGLDHNVTSCKSKNISLFHLTAKNETNSIHFLVDASEVLNIPSVTIVYANTSNNDSSLKVDYDVACRSKAIDQFVKVPHTVDAYGFALYRIGKYNDTDGKVIPPAKIKIYEYANSFKYYLVSHDKDFDDNGFLSLHYLGFNDKNSTIKFKVKFSKNSCHDSIHPSLEFTPGLNVQFEFSFEDLVSQPQMTATRYTYEYIIYSWLPLNDDEQFEVISKRAISDELTPGLYEYINVNLNNHIKVADTFQEESIVSLAKDAYIQFRNSCYVSSEDRKMTNARSLHLSTSTDNKFVPPGGTTRYSRAVASGFFGLNGKISRPNIRLMPMSCGDADDGYYAKTNENVLNFAFGFGQAPKTKLSSFSITLLTISVAIPGACLLSFFAYIGVQWALKKRSSITRYDSVGDQLL